MVCLQDSTLRGACFQVHLKHHAVCAEWCTLQNGCTSFNKDAQCARLLVGAGGESELLAVPACLKTAIEAIAHEYSVAHGMAASTCCQEERA